MKTRTSSGEKALLIITCIVVLISVIINMTNSSLRIYEIKDSLSPGASSVQDISHSSLIIQYRMRIGLHEKKISQADLDMAELHAASMFPSLWTFPEREKNDLLMQAGAFIINGVKAFLGKPPVPIGQSWRRENTSLYTAYFYEQNSMYLKAVSHYMKALEFEKDPFKRAGIQLHTGFCKSMSGRTEEAKEIYRNIMDRHRGSPVSVTASVLLDLLQGITRESDRVKRIPDSPEKSEMLFNLIAFRDSLSVIKRIESGKHSASSPMLQLYKARCLEFTGHPDKAIEIYQKLIINNPGSEEAKGANRRILSMTIRNGSRKEGLKLARKNNKLISDRKLESFIVESGKISSAFTGAGYAPSVISAPAIKNSQKQIDDRLKPAAGKFTGKKVKIRTLQGDLIIGKCTGETESTVIIETIAGRAIIKKKMIRTADIL